MDSLMAQLRPSRPVTTLPWSNQPPNASTTYAIPQLEGERLTISGSKGIFRILTSAKQTNGLMAVFQSGAVLSDAPGFHYHDRTHGAYLVIKGYLKLWNGDKCRILGPGDFAYVPPKVIHNPEMLGPHTELYSLVTPGDWVDFFRYISEPYYGILLPEADDCGWKPLLTARVQAAADKFDVVFQPNYQPPELGEWTAEDEKLPPESSQPQPFFLRANTGPRWLLGGVMSRPFITTAQSNGVCAISSIESSCMYPTWNALFTDYLTFTKVDHCLCVVEGKLIVSLQETEMSLALREGETIVIPAGKGFSLHFDSRYVRFWSFADGDGIESLVHRLGAPFEGVVLPEEMKEWDYARVKEVIEEVGVEMDLHFGPA